MTDKQETQNINGQNGNGFEEQHVSHRIVDAVVLASIGREVLVGGKENLSWVGATDRARAADKKILDGEEFKELRKGRIGAQNGEEPLNPEAIESLRRIRERVDGYFQTNGNGRG